MDDFDKKWVCSDCGIEFIYDYYKNSDESANELNNRDFFNRYHIGEDTGIVICDRCVEKIVKQYKDNKHAYFQLAHPIKDKLYDLGLIVAGAILIPSFLLGFVELFKYLRNLFF